MDETQFKVWLGLMVAWIVVVTFYFVPAIIAMNRKHHNRYAIVALNLLLGWTGLGWIAALVWALTAVRPDMGPDAY